MAGTNEKLVGMLAERIAERISSGQYPPGARLRQEALAEEFAVSRTPIREALRQLEVRGVIQHIPNQGATVRAPSAREIREAYQVRAELEGLAAELCVEWITDEQVSRMRSAQGKFARIVEELVPVNGKAASSTRRAKNIPNWVEANDEFHRVIVEASGNLRLGRVIHDLHSGFTRNVMMSALAMDGRRMRENVSQHDAILNAIARHDAIEARRVMTHHVRRSGELVVLWLESQGNLSID